MYKHMNKKWFATLTAIVTLASSPIALPFQQAIVFAAPGDAIVTITKYVEGAQATGVTAQNAGFPMTATWSSTNYGAGSGTYVLGQNNDPVPYQAQTVTFATGADYSTSEDLTGNAVGASCAEGKPFALVGYTTGDTMAEAMAGTPTMTVPAFSGMTSDKYVIVWNDDCAIPAVPEFVTVTINKYVEGTQASSSTAMNASFPMTSTWSSTSTGSGAGSYSLDATNAPMAYQAETSQMSSGANYSTNEVLTGSTVGASCSEGKPFALVGYTTGDTMAEAASSTPSMTAPAFTGMTNDKYVIVWNHDCSNVEGGLNGDVNGGSSPYGVLNVTSIEALDTTATADGTFANGWQYAFNVTVPSNETGVAMKFADWINSSASSTLPVANNMRISSAQANNAGATILVTAANTYTIPNLVMTGDLDLMMTGKQVRILVEVAVPANTVNGSYSTTYGVRSQ